MTHFAGSDQLGHRAHGLLDRHVRVDAVLVVQVDGIDAQPLEAGVAARVHVFGATVDAALRGSRIAKDAELGGDKRLAHDGP